MFSTVSTAWRTTPCLLIDASPPEAGSASPPDAKVWLFRIANQGCTAANDVRLQQCCQKLVCEAKLSNVLHHPQLIGNFQEAIRRTTAGASSRVRRVEEPWRCRWRGTRCSGNSKHSSRYVSPTIAASKYHRVPFVQHVSRNKRP